MNSMPRVIIDLERTKYWHTGLGQYCLQIAVELSRRAPRELGFLPTFYVPAASQEKLIEQGLAPSSMTVLRPWQKVLPYSLPHADLWHSTHQDSAYFPGKSYAGKVVLSIHDLNFLEEKSASKIQARLRRLQKKIDRADALTVISQFTEQVVRRHLRVEKPMHVIPNGAEKETRPATRPLWLRGAKFFFALGVIVPKKNFHTLIPMMTQFPEHHLILAGPDDHAYAEEIRQSIAELGLGERVFLVGPVDGSTKSWLYQNCEAFLFPSLREGFGIPVAEAMQWGKLVVCSDRTSLPEVGGSHANYWHNFETQSMASVLQNALTKYNQDPLSHAQAIQSWASQFTWARAAQSYARVYQSLL